MCSSAGPGRSQQLEIPLSLNSKRAACFSSSTGISLGAEISTPQGFCHPPDFLWPEGFYHPPDFYWPQGFSNPPDFQQPQGFSNPPDFYWPQVFVHISSILFFCILY
jgi:hypothetical protein